MSWLFSQALVEEYLGDTCLDGEQSAPLSGNNIQQAYCAPDKMTKFSRLSRFGMTYKPLTESRGEELLTLYLEDFHARTLAQPAKVQALKETNPQCGNTWQGSLGRLDPSTSLWRTAQCSLLEDLELSLQTFPRWGLMQNGALYPQQTLVQTISVKEFGLEPNNETFFHTPNTTGMDGGSNSRKALKKRLQLPTPDASTRGPTKNYDPKSKSQSGRTLQSFVAKWPTPTTMDTITRSKESYLKAQNRPRQGKNLTKLGDIIYWPTPMSTEHKANRQTRENHQNGLTQAVLQAETKMLPTPCNRDYKGAVKSGKRITKSGKTQNYGEQLPNVVGGQLNPTWVEWLMGWPVGWTDLKPLAMDKSLYVQQLHGSYSNE